MGAEAEDARKKSSHIRKRKSDAPCQATKTRNVSPDRTNSKSSNIKSEMARDPLCSSPKQEVHHARHNEPSIRESDTLLESLPIIDRQPYREPPSRDVVRCVDGEDDDLIPIPPCTSEAEANALISASPYPPVTTHSLEELELTYIQSNIILRIDINFDHDLHFTPISGEKGDQKKRDAENYWLALGAEFKIVHHHSQMVSCPECDQQRNTFSDRQVLTQHGPTFRRRLSLLFQKLKDLLIILVPERDIYQINEYLDLSLLLQEESHGLLDIVRLAQWLDVLLTSHCAPMRDISAHKMAEKIKQGTESGDVQTLVAGIEMLFQILEAMKLDVANHQIRSFRFNLIDDTVAFQQEFFRSKIASGDFAVGPSKEWYGATYAEHRSRPLDRQTPRSIPLAVLNYGMLELCLRHDLKIPATFAYDHKRLKEIRVDILDFIHLDMCLIVFNQLCSVFTAAQSKRGQQRSVSDSQIKETHFRLRNRIMDITDGNPDEVPQIWLQHTEAIAIEISRTVSYMWSGPTTPISAVMVASATRGLTDMFRHEHENQERAQRLQMAIEQEAHKHAIKFQNMTALDISHAQKRWQQTRAQRYRWRLLPEIEDIARRLAHMGSIHWRVWADLVYLDSGSVLDTGIEDSGYNSGEDTHMTDGQMDFVQRSVPGDTPVH